MNESEISEPISSKPKASPWLTIIAPAFISGVLGAATAIGGGYLTFANKDRELDVRLIEISLAILKGHYEPDSQDKASIIQARKFAIRTVARLAETHLEPEEIAIWSEGGNTPFDTSGIASSTTNQQKLNNTQQLSQSRMVPISNVSGALELGKRFEISENCPAGSELALSITDQFVLPTKDCVDRTGVFVCEIGDDCAQKN